MNLNRPLTEGERALLQYIAAPSPELLIFSIFLKSGINDRENLEKQGASSDFIAQFERFTAGQHEDQATREAWLMGFRAPPRTKKKAEQPAPEAKVP